MRRGTSGEMERGGLQVTGWGGNCVQRLSRNGDDELRPWVVVVAEAGMEMWGKWRELERVGGVGDDPHPPRPPGGG